VNVATQRLHLDAEGKEVLQNPKTRQGSSVRKVYSIRVDFTEVAGMFESLSNTSEYSSQPSFTACAMLANEVQADRKLYPVLIKGTFQSCFVGDKMRMARE
jgi:hypothetical protein